MNVAECLCFHWEPTTIVVVGGDVGASVVTVDIMLQAKQNSSQVVASGKS